MFQQSTSGRFLQCRLSALAVRRLQPTHSPSIQGCNAEAVHSMIGKTATPALLEKARELADAQRARVLRPNDVVTLEYDSQRLNLHTDEELTIERIHCG